MSEIMDDHTKCEQDTMITLNFISNQLFWLYGLVVTVLDFGFFVNYLTHRYC